MGTRLAGVVQDFADGNIETTDRGLDLAVSGKGFFRFESAGEIIYSRNGQLTMDRSGYLTNASGARLTGYPAGIDFGGQPQVMQIPSVGLPAYATNSIQATFNFDTRSPLVDRGTVAFDPANANSYSYTNSVTLYDSLGTPHQSQMYFTKTALNTWEVRLVRDNEVAPEIGELTFDGNGLLDTATGLDAFSFAPANGSDPMAVSMELEGSTQFANEFELAEIFQDGYVSGTLMQVNINELGEIVGTYSNEQERVLGTIALANFQSLEGLQPAGDNGWRETTESGQPIVSVPGQGQFGSIMAGAVEASNVDLTQELVAMIIAQRNYQANAQSIKSQDEALQTTMQLR